jgi:hypothetical protein
LAKRHESLIPLSREHHPALICAMALKRAEGGTPAEKLEALAMLLGEWRERLRGHLMDEERLLPHLMSATERSRLVAEHETLRAYLEEARQCVARDLCPEGVCRRIGEHLDAHIRWEERQLFAAIEQRATEPQLAALAAQTGT